ncbi:MAG: glycerophosphodiester phosphodiesterase family protein [Geodermatophilaceae bacterium]
MQCSYDVPRGERLELHGERDEMRYGGRGVTDHFPRWQTAYVQGGRVGNRTYRYTIANADRSLHHDFTDLKTNGHAGRRFREIDGPFDDQRDLAFLAIARRGAASVYPENTVAACKHAVRAQGANSVQVDVCLTADGELAVYHDADPEDFGSLLRREGIGDVAAFRPTVPPATGAGSALSPH